METLSSRIAKLRRGLAALAAYAIAAGLISIALSIPDMIDGEVFGFARSAIGIVGVGAGLLTLSGKTIGLNGWQSLMLWSALQLPVYADEKGGNLFRQLIEIPAGATSSKSFNGEITEYSQIGINILAIALLIVGSQLRERWNLSQQERATALSHA